MSTKNLTSPSQFISTVLQKDRDAIKELASIMPEYTPPESVHELIANGESALEMLDEMVALLRSACCIAERQGKDTNWDGFIKSIHKLGLSGVTARTYRAFNQI